MFFSVIDVSITFLAIVLALLASVNESLLIADFWLLS